MFTAKFFLAGTFWPRRDGYQELVLGLGLMASWSMRTIKAH
jgi:hypothetical protein